MNEITTTELLLDRALEVQAVLSVKRRERLLAEAETLALRADMHELERLLVLATCAEGV